MTSIQTKEDRRSRQFSLLPLWLALLLVSGAALSHAQTSDIASTDRPAQELRRYKLEDGEFSVLLPAAPALSSNKSHGPLEPLEKNRIRHTIGAYHQGVAYGIYVFENSQPLDEFINWFPYRQKGEFKRNLKVSGMTGKEYGSKDVSGMSLIQFIVSRKRAYAFIAGGSILGNQDVDIPRFFQSISFEHSADANLIAEGPSESQSTYTRPTVTESEPYSGRQVDLKTRVMTKPEPSYTESARQAQITGTVVLRAIFSASGEVDNIRVVSGLQLGLTERAVAAASQIKFIPAIKDGKFVSMWIQLEYNFNLY